MGARRRGARRVLLRLSRHHDLGRHRAHPQAVPRRGGGGGVTVYETLLTSRERGVARITLNRPDVRNALSRTLIQELEAALAAAEADAEARVIVLAGAGDKAFCAGADLKGVGAPGTPPQGRGAFRGPPRVLQALARVENPVTAPGARLAPSGGAGA